MIGLIEIIELILYFFGLVSILLAFSIVVLLARSKVRFTKGELQKMIENFVFGTAFIFGLTLSQFVVDVFNLKGTLIDIFKYFFLVLALFYYLKASQRIYKLSKVFGFASEEIPKKLKKVLKS